MSTVDTVPTQPTDPEAAAPELIVRMPGQVLSPDFPHLLTEALQDYAGLLHAEGAFARPVVGRP